jgi:aminoglycoside phosphotransferase (APT) family kinase protein
VAALNMPTAEVDVSEDLVRRLLAAQHPDLVDRRLRLVANGWDNAIFRLGDDLAVRLSRRQLGADLVANEHRWLPELAARLPMPIAAPVRTGRPTEEYPWAWSVCSWFDGEVAADAALSAPALEAQRLGAFVRALHTEAPPEAPDNPWRGQPIADLRPRIDENVDRLGTLVVRRVVARRAAELSDVDDWTGPPIWLHGDLHTANVVVRHGRLAAVLDFGDITSGDPACDLAIAWMLFTGSDRTIFRAAASTDDAPVDDATWQRAQVWALHFALLYLLHSADNDRFRRMGRSLLAALDAAG